MICVTCKRRPVSLAGKRTYCALCNREQVYAREITSRIERAYTQARQQQKDARKAA